MAKKTYKCVVSGKPIPAERVSALKELGIPEHMWTCVEHSLTRPKKGLFLGEVGTSTLLIVDKVYDDSVRSVFRRSKPTSEKEEAEEEIVASADYDQKELNYYSSDDEQVDPEEKIEIVKRQNS
jgi:hypothetical protein